MNPASMFHSKARSLQLALAQKRPWRPPLWASSPFCLSSRDDRALVPVHSAVKILSVILDLNPHLTYGDMWLLLGGTGMMSRSRDVCKADTVEPLPSQAAHGPVLGPHLRTSQTLGAVRGPQSPGLTLCSSATCLTSSCADHSVHRRQPLLFTDRSHH